MISMQHLGDIGIFGVTVVSGERAMGRSVDHTAKERQNHGILYIFTGEATFVTDTGETLCFADGDLVLLSKNARYRMTYTAKSTSFVVVNFDLCDRGGEEIKLFDGITRIEMHEKRDEVERLMRSFCSSGALKSMTAMLRKKELLYRALGLIFGSESVLIAHGGFGGRIAEGVRLLEQTYLENLPISTFASASRVSVTHFRNLFQKQFSTSPLKYRIRLRIERARELLSEGDFTVAEAAYACGFENLGYFSRCYRRLIGQTPAQTKKNSRA